MLHCRKPDRRLSVPERPCYGHINGSADPGGPHAQKGAMELRLAGTAHRETDP